MRHLLPPSSFTLVLALAGCVQYEENPGGGTTDGTCHRFDDLGARELAAFCERYPLGRPAHCSAGKPAPGDHGSVCEASKILHCAWTDCDWAACVTDLQDAPCDALPASCWVLGPDGCDGEVPTTGDAGS